MDVPHFAYLLISGWLFELVPLFGHCEECYQHFYASLCVDIFLFLGRSHLVIFLK